MYVPPKRFGCVNVVFVSIGFILVISIVILMLIARIDFWLWVLIGVACFILLREMLLKVKADLELERQLETLYSEAERIINHDISHPDQ